MPCTVCQPRPHPPPVSTYVHKIDFQVQLRVSFFNGCNLLHALLATTKTYLSRSHDKYQPHRTARRIVSSGSNSLYYHRYIHSTLPYDDLRQFIRFNRSTPPRSRAPFNFMNKSHHFELFSAYELIRVRKRARMPIFTTCAINIIDVFSLWSIYTHH